MYYNNNKMLFPSCFFLCTIRFFHDDTEMLGVDLKIQLPLSEVSDYFDSHPEFTFHPWFFNTEGE